MRMILQKLINLLIKTFDFRKMINLLIKTSDFTKTDKFAKKKDMIIYKNINLLVRNGKV